MKVFVCDDTIDNIMTGIYDAWEYGIQHGHDQVSLQKGASDQFSLFDTYAYVDTDACKAEKVIRSIRNKISYDAYISVYYACLSQKDMLRDVYRFLRIGFQIGADVRNMLQDDSVMRVMLERKRIANEAHHFREFARFDEWNEVLICHLEPKNRIISLLGDYFADRMPSEDWMIIDDIRQEAVVHPKDRAWYMRTLTVEEYTRLTASEANTDQYTRL